MKRLGHRNDCEFYNSLPKSTATRRHGKRLHLLLASLLRRENGDQQEDQRGRDAADETRLRSHGDGEDAADDEGAEIGPAGPAERPQLLELREQGEEVHDDDGRERGVGNELDDVGEHVETENDQQRRDEVVERRLGLCGDSHDPDIPQEAMSAVRESEPAGG
mgnify:CR=1 FL=1